MTRDGDVATWQLVDAGGLRCGQPHRRLSPSHPTTRTIRRCSSASGRRRPAPLDRRRHDLQQGGSGHDLRRRQPPGRRLLRTRHPPRSNTRPPTPTIERSLAIAQQAVIKKSTDGGDTWTTLRAPEPARSSSRSGRRRRDRTRRAAPGPGWIRRPELDVSHRWRRSRSDWRGCSACCCGCVTGGSDARRNAATMMVQQRGTRADQEGDTAPVPTSEGAPR